MKPLLMKAPVSKECENCKDIFQPYRPQNKFCKKCQTETAKSRKAVWAYDNYQKVKDDSSVIARRSVNVRKRKSRIKEQGKALSTINRFSGYVHPTMVWSSTISFPFSYALSKNAVWRSNIHGHAENRRISNLARATITRLVKLALAKDKITVRQNKLWLGFFVEKPDMQGDAINIVDLVCDAVKDAIDLDDRWFSINYLDWSVVKENPLVHLQIGQTSLIDIGACGACGQLLPFSEFGKYTGRKSGIARWCKKCSRVSDAERRLRKRESKT